MSTATKIKNLTGFTGSAALFHLDPPLKLRDWDNNETGETEYVIVSATVTPFGGGPETYIFPATSDGAISDWGELDGSYKGGLDHAEALEGAGYEVAA